MHPNEDTGSAATGQPSPILDTQGPDPHAVEIGDAGGVELAVDGHHAVEWVAGDVDIANSGHVGKIGAAAIAEADVDELVVDLSQVTFLDASGIGALVKLQEDAHAADKRLALRGVPPPVSKILALTDLENTFGLGDDDNGRC